MHARAVAKFLLRDVIDDGFDESYLTVYFTDIAQTGRTIERDALDDERWRDIKRE